MAGKSRKVSFYLLVLEKKEPIQGSRHKRFVPLKNDEIEEHFRNIYDNKMQSLSNGNKAISVNFSSGTDIVEVLDYTNHCKNRTTKPVQYSSLTGSRNFRD